MNVTSGSITKVTLPHPPSHKLQIQLEPHLRVLQLLSDVLQVVAHGLDAVAELLRLPLQRGDLLLLPLDLSLQLFVLCVGDREAHVQALHVYPSPGVKLRCGHLIFSFSND